eukprot:c2372_g1_i1.p1 GENE.c2372_g1_i1~~c2372_g1_i1.p1  ORF type:complete len:340 (-),score=106.12 c2372_g1_i1:32-1051(-)
MYIKYFILLIIIIYIVYGGEINHNYAYVTLAYPADENLEFLKGVLALAESLKTVQSVYPLVVMWTNMTESSISPLLMFGCEHLNSKLNQRLRSSGFHCYLHQVDPIAYEFPQHKDIDPYLNSHFHISLTKLRAWQIPFEKAVFLDSDTLALANSDMLFQYPELSGVLDGDQRRKDFYFNAGVFVLVPSNDTFSSITKALGRHQRQYYFPDQDFINLFFTNKTALDNEFNVQLGHGRRVVSKVRILHFFATPKPWNFMSDKDIENITLGDYKLITEFADSHARELQSYISHQLVADGDQGYEKYPEEYIIKAFSLWFDAYLRARKIIEEKGVLVSNHKTY